MGVWIEMTIQKSEPLLPQSLPLWECGLKSPAVMIYTHLPTVTPFMGVWIEILMRVRMA